MGLIQPPGGVRPGSVGGQHPGIGQGHLEVITSPPALEVGGERALHDAGGVAPGIEGRGRGRGVAVPVVWGVPAAPTTATGTAAGGRGRRRRRRQSGRARARRPGAITLVFFARTRTW